MLSSFAHDLHKTCTALLANNDEIVMHSSLRL